jgi:hypothetical protein
VVVIVVKDLAILLFILCEMEESCFGWFGSISSEILVLRLVLVDVIMPAFWIKSRSNTLDVGCCDVGVMCVWLDIEFVNGMDLHDEVDDAIMTILLLLSLRCCCCCCCCCGSRGSVDDVTG